MGASVRNGLLNIFLRAIDVVALSLLAKETYGEFMTKSPA